MGNINTQESAQESASPIEARQIRTRDRIFQALQSGVEFGTNAAVATGRTIGYVAGQTYRGAKETVEGFKRGKNGEPIHDIAA